MTDAPATKSKSPTLRRDLRLTIVGSAVLIVIAYSIGLVWFFISGLDIAGSIELKGVAENVKSELASGTKQQAPVLRNLYRAYSYEDLPERVQKAFADEEIRPGELEITGPEEDDPEYHKDYEDSDEEEILYMMLAEPLQDGRTLYLVRELRVGPEILDDNFARPGQMEGLIIFSALGVVLAVLLLSHLLSRRINGRITALQSWADQLTGASGRDARPDFRYQELNQIADHLAGSISRIDQFVRREQDFLRQASHELRTPIAVISGNVSVLDALPLTDQQKNVSARIRRASRSMQHIVTTLLWLGREDEPVPEPEQVDLADLARSTITSHDYLLTGKDILVGTKLPQTEVSAPLVPLEIAAANMIRNGFQHTEAGQIVISVDPGGITVENTLSDTAQDPAAGLTAGGGVGLNLIRRIADRLGWRFSLSVTGRTVTARLDLFPDGAASGDNGI